MCSSTATLIYGIWVTSKSLDSAATAHSRLQPVTRAIALILLRRRLGTLEVEKAGTGVSRLPEEVWDLILKELSVIELRRAKRKTASDWDEYGAPFSGKKEVTTLLASYGLCVPSVNSWNSASGGSAIAISLPFRTTKSPSPARTSTSTDHYSGSYTDAAHAVNTLSPSLFDLPPDADRRFASLLRDHKLTKVKIRGTEIVHSLSPFKVQAIWDKAEEVQATEMQASKPRWMIWNSLFPCMMGD